MGSENWRVPYERVLVICHESLMTSSSVTQSSNGYIMWFASDITCASLCHFVKTSRPSHFSLIPIGFLWGTEPARHRHQNKMVMPPNHALLLLSFSRAQYSNLQHRYGISCGRPRLTESAAEPKYCILEHHSMLLPHWGIYI